MTHTSPHTILIIDDNERLITSYRDFLQEAGLTITTATNGEEGLKKAAQHKPDLILLDLMMPEMDGLTMLKTLKKDDTLKDIPVMVMTALVNELERDNSLKAGAVEYIEKVETEPEQLLHKIRHLLKQAH
ncbi:MAG TPA: response regulator [Patescibacteria group bacterium]